MRCSESKGILYFVLLDLHQAERPQICSIGALDALQFERRDVYDRRTVLLTRPCSKFSSRPARSSPREAPQWPLDITLYAATNRSNANDKCVCLPCSVDLREIRFRCRNNFNEQLSGTWVYRLTNDTNIMTPTRPLFSFGDRDNEIFAKNCIPEFQMMKHCREISRINN